MKILVIGGTRFIGAALVRSLHAMGHEVAVFNRGQSPAEPPAGVQRITGDLNALQAMREDFVRFGPEVVLHNMVLHDGHVRSMQDVFRGIARRLVMTSSMDTYRIYGRIHGTEPGDPLPLPVNEDSPLREKLYPYRHMVEDESNMMYHYDKIPAEQAVMDDPDLPGTVLRLPMVIGPGDYQRRLLGFVKPMLDQRPALVLLDAYANWVSTYGYVDNVGHAMALACVDERAAGRIYNVGDTAVSTLYLAEHVRDAMNWPGEIITAPQESLPESFAPQLNLAQDLICSTERIRQELGFHEIVPFNEGIRRTVEWDCANLPDPLPEALREYAEQDKALAALGR